MELSRLPPRVIAALAITLLALAVLGGRALLSGGDGDGDARGASSTTSSSPVTSSPPAALTTISVEILPEWFPKQTSRYSEREPVVSLTTVPTTSSIVPDEDPTGAQGTGAGSSGPRTAGSGSG